MDIWLMAALIFGLRVLDVSLGTVRTLAVVHERIRASVVLGFLEILIWVTALSQVVVNLHRSPLLLLAYAGGFATGNATGILLERRLAWGSVLVRILSRSATAQIADRVRGLGQWATIFSGEGAGGPEAMIFTTCARARVREVLDASCKLDPEVVYSVEPILITGPRLHHPLQPALGWRARFLRK